MKWYSYFTAFRSNFSASAEYLNGQKIMWECDHRREGYYFSILMTQNQHDKFVEFIFSDAIVDEP